MLVSMPREKLSSYKIALVERIVKTDERLDEESNRWWQEIALFQYSWRRRDEEARFVTSIDKDALLAYFDRFIGQGSGERRRLVAAVFAQGNSAAMARMNSQSEARGAIVVSDPQKYCSELPKWPLVDRSPSDSL